MELSIFSRQLKMKSAIKNDNRLIAESSNKFWFWGMEEETNRQNAKGAKADLEALQPLESR